MSQSCLRVNSILILYWQQCSVTHVATRSLCDSGQYKEHLICSPLNSILPLMSLHTSLIHHYSFLISHLSSLISHLFLLLTPYNSSFTPCSSSLLTTHLHSISSLICSTRSVFPEPFNPLMDERETLDRNSEKSLSDYKSKNFYIWRVPCENSAQLHRYVCVLKVA